MPRGGEVNWLRFGTGLPGFGDAGGMPQHETNTVKKSPCYSYVIAVASMWCLLHQHQPQVCSFLPHSERRLLLAKPHR